MASPFDQFDAAPSPAAKRGNAFDRFDKVAAPAVRAVKPMHPEFDGSHIPGYNPETGRVEKYGKAGSAAMGAADTASMAFGDEGAAGVIYLIEKLRGEGKPYTEILKQVRGNQDAAYQDNPKSYIGGMVAGGVAGGSALAKSGASLTGRAIARGAPLKRVAGASAAEGAAFGGVSGVGSGTDLESRALGGVAGGMAGLTLGAATPYALAGLGAAAQPLVAPVMARLRPDRYAERAIGEGLRRSGRTPDEIADELLAARGDGQGVFTVADAMGNSGQRMLSTAARNPHEGRQAVIEALEARQAGQGRRVAGALEEGFGRPMTAAQQEAQTAALRAREGNLNYGAARGEAGPVDVRPAIDALDARVPPQSFPEGIADGSVYSEVRGARRLLTPNRGAFPAPDEAIPQSTPVMPAEDAAARLRQRTNTQERRALNDLAPAAGPRPKKPLSLSEFVASRGGIKDFQGDAAAVAGDAKNRFGRLVREEAKSSLDTMREAAEEAGYLGGYTSDEFGRASVDDLLRALDDDLRGTPIYAQENMSEAAALEGWEAAQGMRDTARNNLDRIGQEVTGSVSDDVVNRAARLMEAESIDADEALMRAISDDIAENGIPPQEVRPGMFADPQNPGARPPAEPVLDFDRAHMVKVEMDALIQKGGPTAALLREARQKLDDQLAQASRPYAQARDTYRAQSQALEAVDTGRDAARRGRVEDTIPAFQSMRPDQQAGFRAGYVDPLIEAVQGAPVGSNKVRPLINDATAAEFPAFAAPGQADRLGRRLGREQTMFETRAAALGGSKTADNLADAADMSQFDPAIMGNILRGRPISALVSAITRGMNEAKGLPPSVIERVARALMETNPDAARGLLAAGGRRNAATDGQRAVVNAIINDLGASSSGRLATP